MNFPILARAYLCVFFMYVYICLNERKEREHILSVRMYMCFSFFVVVGWCFILYIYRFSFLVVDVFLVVVRLTTKITITTTMTTTTTTNLVVMAVSFIYACNLFLRVFLWARDWVCMYVNVCVCVCVMIWYVCVCVYVISEFRFSWKKRS